MKEFIAFVLIMIIFIIGVIAGYQIRAPVVVREVITIEVMPESYYNTEVVDDITLDEALTYLREARFTHQYIIDKGSANEITGNNSYQRKWVDRYTQIIELLEAGAGDFHSEQTIKPR